MKALDIIDALTRMGCTEGTGLIESPSNKKDIAEWLTSWFGGDIDSLKCEGHIKLNKKYVYSYNEKLWTLKGVVAPNATIEIKTEIVDCEQLVVRETEEFIYLYEVE